jgi:hypothetical protein
MVAAVTRTPFDRFGKQMVRDALERCCSIALHYTRLVVVSELPVTRDTLLVRLLGAGSTLKHAIAELQALPAD